MRFEHVLESSNEWSVVHLPVQRYTHLKLKPDDLITSGFFAIVRNANYIGETLIYLGFVGVPYSNLAILHF